jgi:hypothetical protein
VIIVIHLSGREKRLLWFSHSSCPYQEVQSRTNSNCQEAAFQPICWDEDFADIMLNDSVIKKMNSMLKISFLIFKVSKTGFLLFHYFICVMIIFIIIYSIFVVMYKSK